MAQASIQDGRPGSEEIRNDTNLFNTSIPSLPSSSIELNLISTSPSSTRADVNTAPGEIIHDDQHSLPPGAGVSRQESHQEDPQETLWQNNNETDIPGLFTRRIKSLRSLRHLVESVSATLVGPEKDACAEKGTVLLALLAFCLFLIFGGLAARYPAQPVRYMGFGFSGIFALPILFMFWRDVRQKSMFNLLQLSNFCARSSHLSRT